MRVGGRLAHGFFEYICQHALPMSYYCRGVYDDVCILFAGKSTQAKPLSLNVTIEEVLGH